MDVDNGSFPNKNISVGKTVQGNERKGNMMKKMILKGNCQTLILLISLILISIWVNVLSLQGISNTPGIHG